MGRAQNFWLGRLAKKHGVRAAWIGYNDIKKEKHWVWSGNKRNNFRSWNRGEPNNYRTEDCVEMFQNGKWNDLACRAKRAFACQRTNRRAVHLRRMKALRRNRLRALHAKRRAAAARRSAAIRRAKYLRARALANKKRGAKALRARRARAAKLAKRRAYLAKLRANKLRLSAQRRARAYKALRARQARARVNRARARKLAHAKRMRAKRDSRGRPNRNFRIRAIKALRAKGWRLCAREHARGSGRVCRCDGTIKYGARGRFSHKKSTSSKKCDNRTFGDPKRGVRKDCFCDDSGTKRKQRAARLAALNRAKTVVAAPACTTCGVAAAPMTIEQKTVVNAAQTKAN